MKKYKYKNHYSKPVARQVIGIHSCLETLKVRPRKVRAIYIQKNWSQNKELKKVIEYARQYKIEVIEKNKSQLHSFGVGHQGVALTVEENPHCDLNSASTLIYIDRIEDPRNLGSIIRTSWLMGVNGIFLPKQDSIKNLTSTVNKVASGGVEHVPVEFIDQPKKWFEKMKKHGFWFYSLDSRSKKTISDISFSDKKIFVLGCEGRGIRPSIKNQCDEHVSIPQVEKTAHYNLSVALSITLYQSFVNSKKDSS